MLLNKRGGGVKTLQFRGIFLHQPVTILVDSGSSASFISEQLVSQLSVDQVQCLSVSVRVANGTILHCSAHLPDAVWTIQQYQFTHNLKILPLTQYDIIIGMDWLQRFSPMKVDWLHRWLLILHKGTSVKLQGTIPEDVVHDQELLVQIFSLSSDEAALVVQLPPEISALLTEFPSLVTPPHTLPPRRNCDNKIPLVEGARHVSVRPYRYPPTLKDEIEAQVDAMLQQGIIQLSTSPFNSPVLLVKKKDNSWRFRVDYRYLNALTVKMAFPILVFD